MTNLLHISYDLRRRKNAPVTSAVKDVINQTGKFAEVKTIDLLRVPSFKEEMLAVENKNHLLVNSFGLPFGIFLIYGLKRAYGKIVDAENKGIIISAKQTLSMRIKLPLKDTSRTSLLSGIIQN